MFDKDLNIYLRTANRALPCGTARTAFACYINEVAQDVLRNDPNADFAAVTEQLGSTPRQAAEDFMESQPPETLARWEAEGRHRKRTVILAVGVTIAALAAALAFFVVTKGYTDSQHRNDLYRPSGKQSCTGRIRRTCKPTI